jgi:hypothetical protein
VTACRCSNLVACFVVFGLEDVVYDNVIRIITVFTLPLMLSSINVLLVYACYSL